MGCPAIFVEDPERFLQGLDLRLASAVDPGSPATLAAEFRTTVNGQLYWVASADELRRLRERPFEYSGPLRDPVTGERFEPSAASPRHEDDAQILLFASERTAAGFRLQPEAPED